MADATRKWSGKDMSQEEFMLRDECILVNMNDEDIGHDNKYESHIFCNERPRAKLHRAFSVFLFNPDGKLLLQQRAASKITFPNVWTNTCCSHPLHGYSPTEIDSSADIASGDPQGVKRAAIRKLEHELGIDPTTLSTDEFKFLTRLHYWAADVVTHGKNSPFGEHEIDHILFIQTTVEVKPHPEEVSDFKYVTQDELKSMMSEDSGLLWSPWFRIIADRFLGNWWKDLNKTLTTNELVDVNTIHRFDCTGEHMGGAGGAGGWLDQSGDESGDKWLAAVAANGNKAPESTKMQPLLKKVENTNQYTLAEPTVR